MDLQEIKTKYLKKRFIIPGVIVLALGGICAANFNANKILTRRKSSKKCTITDRDNALIAIVQSGLVDQNVGLEIF